MSTNEITSRESEEPNLCARLTLVLSFHLHVPGPLVAFGRFEAIDVPSAAPELTITTVAMASSAAATRLSFDI